MPNKELRAIDIELEATASNGEAYYRIDENFLEFLKKCEEKQTIIGFIYTPGSYNFGIILKDKMSRIPVGQNPLK